MLRDKYRNYHVSDPKKWYRQLNFIFVFIEWSQMEAFAPHRTLFIMNLLRTYWSLQNLNTKSRSLTNIAMAPYNHFKVKMFQFYQKLDILRRQGEIYRAFKHIFLYSQKHFSFFLFFSFRFFSSSFPYIFCLT